MLQDASQLNRDNGPPKNRFDQTEKEPYRHGQLVTDQAGVSTVVSGTGRKRKRWIIVGVALGVVALAVGVGVGVGVGTKKTSSPSSSASTR